MRQIPEKKSIDNYISVCFTPPPPQTSALHLSSKALLTSLLVVPGLSHKSKEGGGVMEMSFFYTLKMSFYITQDTNSATDPEDEGSQGRREGRGPWKKCLVSTVCQPANGRTGHTLSLNGIQSH